MLEDFEGGFSMFSRLWVASVGFWLGFWWLLLAFAAWWGPLLQSDRGGLQAQAFGCETSTKRCRLQVPRVSVPPAPTSGHQLKPVRALTNLHFGDLLEGAGI